MQASATQIELDCGGPDVNFDLEVVVKGAA
jgi:hypothetical protein